MWAPITENARGGVCHTVPRQTAVIITQHMLWKTYVNVTAPGCLVRQVSLTVTLHWSLRWISCMGK